MAVHLLHIGKTGGTALKAALRSAGVDTAFDGRHRRGRPRYNRRWSMAEALAFTRYPTAASLTERATAALTAWYRDDYALLHELTAASFGDER